MAFYENMHNHPISSLRKKFLTAWDFYAMRYPGMSQALTEGGFLLSALGRNHAWADEEATMTKNIKYFKRISLSLQLSKRKRSK
jgi:hypothetical protein